MQSGKYGAMNTDDTTTMVDYVVKFVSVASTSQENITTYGHVSKIGELSVRAEYLISTKTKTNGYWEQKVNQQSIIFSNSTYFYLYHDVSVVKYVAYVPRTIYVNYCVITLFSAR